MRDAPGLLGFVFRPHDPDSMNNSMSNSSGAAAAAARGGSPLLQGCMSAGLQARRRASAQRWATLNVLLLALLLYDLWYKCPGYTSALHAVELALAAVLGVSAVWHSVQLAPPRASARLPATATQLDLLGVHRSHLESSFQLLDSSAGSAASGEGGGAACAAGGDEEVSVLSLSRSWRSAGGSPQPAPRAAAPASPPPDRFIADTLSLADYLRRYEAARAAELAAVRGAWPGCSPPPAAARQYQLAAPAPEDDYCDGGSGGGGGGEVGGAARHVWRRLDIDPHHLTTYNLNLRVWLHVTILQRLVREMASVDEALANHHLPDVKLGEVSVERLRKTAAGALATQHAPSLRALLPFLEPFPHQRYVVRRIKELAGGGALSGYRWDGGGPGWDAGKPTDAELLFHLFVTYMDCTCGAPGEEAAFSSRHVGTLGARPRPPGPAILRAAARPPHWVLQLSPAGPASPAPAPAEDTVSLGAGRNNLLHSLLLLLAALRRAAPRPRAPLGPHALNLLWVIGEGAAPA